MKDTLWVARSVECLAALTDAPWVASTDAWRVAHSAVRSAA